MKNVRRKLGDYGQLWAVEVPAKAARHVAADVRSALCSVGPHQTRVIRLAAPHL